MQKYSIFYCNMKIVLALVGLCALTLAYPQKKITDRVFLERQRDILRLFKHVNQPSYYQGHVDIARNFNIQNHYDLFTKPEVAKRYYTIFKYGLLPRGKIFSIFHEDHLREAVALYRVFYYAVDYETFYRAAVWARQNVNEGLFLYALSVAIVHRPDTYGYILPPIYEIYPHYFHSSEVINEAYRYKQQCQKNRQQERYQDFTINTNYSGYYLNLNPEQSLSYFTEDIGINSFYYYYNIYYPHWLGGEDFNYQEDRRGELYFYIHQQILVRYYLERLSNAFGEIPVFNYELPIETGYCPSLQYPNGLEFPSRPHHADLREYYYNHGQRYGHNKYAYSYTHVQDLERRIRDAIDRGYVYSLNHGERIDLYTNNGINTLGNLIQSNPDSPDSRYYGLLYVHARHLLGYSPQPLDKHRLAPSALEHYETSLRDPVFYQLYKRMVLHVQKYKSRTEPYTESQLEFGGVRITRVVFDRLVTYFDSFYSDLSNAVYISPDEENEDIKIRARQYRLNHKPFNYRIYVSSAAEQDAVVRVYIGPVFDEYGRRFNISQNRLNLVQFDHFRYRLTVGENVMERNSHQTYFYQNDRTSYKELYQRVLQALETNREFVVDSNEAYFGFPRRFLLPKGTPGGQEYQFYVVVSQYQPYQTKNRTEDGRYYYPRVGTGNIYIDGYPLGFPFDRPIHYDQIFDNIDNFYVYTTKIYHRNADDINASTGVHQPHCIDL